MITDTKRVYEESIEATGSIAELDLEDAGRTGRGLHIGLNIEGSEAASYAIDVGGPDGNGGIHWFTDVQTYDGVSEVADAWTHTARYLRLRVTSAASAGSTAQVYLSEE